MKLRIFSDIHLAFTRFSPQAISTDAVVLVGDIGEGLAVIEWARTRFANVPIVYSRA